MNVLVLASPTLGNFQQRVLDPFFDSARHPIVACLIDGRPRDPLHARLWGNMRKGRGGYVLIMAVDLLRRRRHEARDSEEFFRSLGIPTLVTLQPYGQATIDWIRGRAPDVLILLGGFGIIQQPLLSIARHGVLGYHHGDMRRYRGQPPAFWELYNGERQMGVTVQRLREALDAGEPIVERSVEIRPNDTLQRLQERALDESVDMLFAAVTRFETPGFEPNRIASFGRVYTLPNFRTWLALNLKTLRHRLAG